jgi:hypothetical protein
LEAGSVATPDERRPIGTELALCQRYFEIVRNASATGYNGNLCIATVRYAVVKRTTPTITTPGLGNIIGNSSSFSPSGIGLDDNAIDGFSTDVYCSGLNGTYSYNWRGFSLYSSAEL